MIATTPPELRIEWICQLSAKFEVPPTSPRSEFVFPTTGFRSNFLPECHLYLLFPKQTHINSCRNELAACPLRLGIERFLGLDSEEFRVWIGFESFWYINYLEFLFKVLGLCWCIIFIVFGSVGTAGGMLPH